jgi:hypothetical protein
MEDINWVTYKNSFHQKGNPYSQEIITARLGESPVEYYGYLIYRRLDGDYWVYDIVKDGVCIGMYAGINGAKARIDELS